MDAQLEGDGQHVLRQLFTATKTTTVMFYNEPPMETPTDEPMMTDETKYNAQPQKHYDKAFTGHKSCFRLQIIKKILAAQPYNKGFTSGWEHETNQEATKLQGCYTVLQIFTCRRKRWVDAAHMWVEDLSHWAAVALPGWVILPEN